MIASRTSLPLSQRLQQAIGESQIEYVFHPLFEEPEAEKKFAELTACNRGVEPNSRSTGLRHPLLQLTELPPLTPEAEYQLFCLMNFRKYQAATLVEAGHGSPERVQEMLGEALTLRNELVMRNMRLVIGLARDFQSPRLRLDELVSDACPILIRAVELFDCSRNFNFSTYATHAVRNALVRQLSRFRRNEERMSGFSAEDPPDMIDERSDPWQDEIEATRRGQFLASVMEGLDSRERTIVIARFGLNDQPPQSFQEIGEMVQLSKERVRQISHQAIAKLQERSIEISPEDWEGVEHECSILKNDA